MVVIPQEERLSLHEKFDRLAELVTNRNADDRNSEWIELDAARKMLGISSKTWQNYHDQRVIPFSQIGRKIYVCRADLEDFMRSQAPTILNYCLRHSTNASAEAFNSKVKIFRSQMRGVRDRDFFIFRLVKGFA